MEKMQTKAATKKKLPDGRVCYYTTEAKLKTEGPTRGSKCVMEHNPKSGQTRGWQECYDHLGKVNRVHPEDINGQPIKSKHYPPIKGE